MISHCILIWISLMISDAEHIFRFLLAISMVIFLCKNVYSGPLQSLIGLLFFFLLSSLSSLFTLDTNFLWNIWWFANIFSHSISCIFLFFFPLFCLLTRGFFQSDVITLVYLPLLLCLGFNIKKKKNWDKYQGYVSLYFHVAVIEFQTLMCLIHSKLIFVLTQDRDPFYM